MEPMTGPIRWGIAGTGGIAASFVTDFANLDGDDSGAEIVAVGSRSESSASAFAESHGIGRAHASYEDLASDPDVDAVYVGGIHTVHASLAQVDAMTDAATRNDRFLMEAMWMRFNPAHIEMMKRIADGAIGEVRRVQADFSFALPHSDDHRLWDREKGGGALLDLGIYPLNLAMWVLGPPARVEVAGRVAHGVDDEVSLLCAWESGATATLTAGLSISGTLEGRIEGTNGAIDLPAPAHCTDHMTFRSAAGIEELEAEPAGLRHQVVEVHRCLRAGERESPGMPWAASRAIIEVCDAARAELGVHYDVD